MYSISTYEAKWPTVTAHYIRSMTRRRMFVALSIVLSFLFCWQTVKSPLPEELDLLLRDLNLGCSDSTLGLARRCTPIAEEKPLPVPESRQSRSGRLRDSTKDQRTDTKTEHDQLLKASEEVSEAIKNRESFFVNRIPEDGNRKHTNAVEGFMVSPQSLKTLQLPDENRVTYRVQQPQDRKEKTSKSSTLRTTYPEYSEFADLSSIADTLPDVIHISFEDATADVTLTGWEDEWFSKAEYNAKKWGTLSEPKIDFIYSWVNGSDKAFTDTMSPYEVNSTLNDPEGKWLQSHRINRYRDWDELRYSIRSVEKYAQNVRNKIQILVNSVGTEGVAEKASPENPATITGKQIPTWLNKNKNTKDVVQIIPQEEFFDESEQGCLPTFNSLTIENQIFNTESTVDRFFALSDDMLLGKPHAASDLYSPLFGPTMGFKADSHYNTRDTPTEAQSRLFGEKPYHIYTSWLLNHRFGERKRKAQAHFGHSMGRSVTREAIQSFPRPALQSTCQRFRHQSPFQLSSWYATFQYTIERHREALLWSYIMKRSDTNQDGYLDWNERQTVISDLEEGMLNEGNVTYRTRHFYRMADSLETAGLEAPKVNLDVLWTSLDGPSAIRGVKCDFDIREWVDQCMGPSFSTDESDKHHSKPIFSSEIIFDRIARQQPKCGDCLLKLILNRAEQGLEPLLPPADSQAKARATVVKALVRYQYTIVEPDALFVMATDEEQVEHLLNKRLLRDKREVGQLCVNDDIGTDEVYFVEKVRQKISALYQGLVPERSQFELDL